MRKVNTVVSFAVIIMLLIHAIGGAFQLMGLMPGGSTVMERLARIMATLVVVHMLIGIIFTAKTVQIIKRSGVYYFKENMLFLIRRISGFALMLLLLLHLFLFVRTGEGIFRLNDFDIPQLVGQVLMLLALSIHLLCNIRPLAIALGLNGGSGYGRDVLLILSVVLAFCALAFVIYFLRWNVWWIK
jgi:succinate dehydrogenase/fumarate reductase cytochrome b subunit